jgi:hypothetical protein
MEVEVDAYPGNIIHIISAVQLQLKKRATARLSEIQVSRVQKTP